jgi:hypothetical protein
MSGMRINYQKSELVPIETEMIEDAKFFADIFGCPIGAFLIK